MQNYKKIGKQSYYIESPVSITGFACVGGKKEGEGPLGPYFDCITDEGYFGEKTWEKAESKKRQFQRLFQRRESRFRIWMRFLRGIYLTSA